MVFTTYAQTPNLCTSTLNPPTGGVLPVTDPKWIGVSTDPPFTLSGAPVTTTPVKTPNRMVDYCPGLDQQTPPRPLRREITLDTNGLIIDPVLNSGTTLRITNERVSFNLVFIALHKDIWSDTASPQLSLFFTGRDPVDGLIVYTHICIPVTYTTDDLNTNLFLKSWLTEATPPSGLTVNNLLDAKRGLKFQVMNYCLRNQGGGNSYTLFLSSEPLLLNSNNLPSWLATDTNLIGDQWINNSTYRLKTFSDMYTLAMNVRNPTYTEFFNWNEFSVAKTNKKFVSIMSGSPTQSGITPSYYVLPPGSLSGTAFKTGQRTLPKKQIKCYPINLMKDVDANGNVIVDNNNVPMTTTGAKNEKESETMNIKLNEDVANAQNGTFVFIASIFIGIIALVLILGIIFWFFGSKQSPSVTPPAMAAVAAGAAAIPDPLPPPPGVKAPLPPPPPPPPPPGGLPPPLPSPP